MLRLEVRRSKSLAEICMHTKAPHSNFRWITFQFLSFRSPHFSRFPCRLVCSKGERSRPESRSARESHSGKAKNSETEFRSSEEKRSVRFAFKVLWTKWCDTSKWLLVCEYLIPHSWTFTQWSKQNCISTIFELICLLAHENNCFR